MKFTPIGNHPPIYPIEMSGIDPIIYNLVRLLSHDRLHNFDTWLSVGHCLHNESEDLLSLWDEISRVSNKWDSKCCQRYWNRMSNNHDRPLTIKSLHYWARQDDPDGYAEILNNMLQPLY